MIADLSIQRKTFSIDRSKTLRGLRSPICVHSSVRIQHRDTWEIDQPRFLSMKPRGTKPFALDLTDMPLNSSTSRATQTGSSEFDFLFRHVFRDDCLLFEPQLPQSNDTPKLAW
jgi:hypothetical protein